MLVENFTLLSEKNVKIVYRLTSWQLVAEGCWVLLGLSCSLRRWYTKNLLMIALVSHSLHWRTSKFTLTNHQAVGKLGKNATQVLEGKRPPFLICVALLTESLLLSANPCLQGFADKFQTNYGRPWQSASDQSNLNLVFGTTLNLLRQLANK